MRAFQNMQINFFQRKGKAKNITLYAYVTIDRVRAKTALSTGVRCLPSEWNGNRVKDKVKQQQLEDFKASILEIYQGLKLFFVHVTAEMVHSKFKGDLHRNANFVQFAEKTISEKNYPRNGRDIKRFLKKFLAYPGANNLNLSDVNNVQFGKAYAAFVAQNNATNYASKSFTFVKWVINQAILAGFEKNNALDKITIKKETKDIVFLEFAELEKITSHCFASEYLQRVADMFVFQCFTGFAYVDLAQFSKEMLTIKDGKEWISYHRQKSKVAAIVPFFKEAKAIFEKYNQNLPIITNQKYNAYLKEVGQIVGIDKVLTTHVGRKTAGSIWLNRGLSYEVVAKMLGHSSISTTQRYYAHIQTSRISDEMSKNNFDF